MQCRSNCADEERCRRTALPDVGHCAVHHGALVRWLGAKFMDFTPMVRRELLGSTEFVSRACAHVVDYLLLNPSTTYEALQASVAELDPADRVSLKRSFLASDRRSAASYLNLSKTLGAIFSRGARGLLEPQALLRYAAEHDALDAVLVLLDIVPPDRLAPGEDLNWNQDVRIWDVLWGHYLTTTKEKTYAFVMAVVHDSADLVAAHVSDPSLAKARGPALVMASGHGNVGLLQILVDAGVDPSIQDNGAIRRACEFGRIDAVRFLLALDSVDPSDLDNAAIGLASAAGHAGVVRLLLEDARVDPTDQGDYAVRAASEGGHTDVVRLLLVDGRADPGAQENYAIRYASAFGHSRTVRLLLRDRRVDPSAEGNDAVGLAAANGHADVVRLLLRDRRVDPTDQGDYAVRPRRK